RGDARAACRVRLRPCTGLPPQPPAGPGGVRRVADASRPHPAGHSSRLGPGQPVANRAPSRASSHAHTVSSHLLCVRTHHPGYASQKAERRGVAEVRQIRDTKASPKPRSKAGERASKNGRLKHAEEARSKAERRAAEQSGLAGWVDERARQWSLDGPDWQFMERQKYF